MNCASCNSPMNQGLAPWHYECRECSLESSALEPADLARDDRVVSEAERELGLESIRKHGFSETFRILSSIKSGGSLVDVGCAHGWFLDAAVDAGFECTGIEPSIKVAERALQRGHRVLPGYFPDALPTGESFDVVSFNDVFEHIPDANGVMASVNSILNENGILSIAIPSSRGFFYRVSKWMARLGVIGPFERMWQKHFSSPHLYYFNVDALTNIARRHGFEPVFLGSLPSVRLRGLWDRLSYDKGVSRMKNVVIYGLVVATLPFLRVLPPDIDLVMYRKAKSQ